MFPTAKAPSTIIPARYNNIERLRRIFERQGHEIAAIIVEPVLGNAVVLDLHSGRLFGRYGPFLTDAAAFILLALSISGAWIQWRSWQLKRRHPHKA